MTNPFGTFFTDQIDAGGTGGGGGSGGGTAGGGGNSNTCPFPDTFLRCSQTPGIGIFATGDADSSGRCTEYSALTSVCNAPPPSPSSTPRSSGCTLGGNDCPPGYVCVIKESFSGGAGFFAVPTYTAVCEPIPSQTPIVPPPPSPTPGNTQAKIRCCGPSTGYVCTDVAGTACPRNSAECDTAGLSCAPPPSPTPSSTSPAVSPPPSPTPSPTSPAVSPPPPTPTPTPSTTATQLTYTVTLQARADDGTAGGTALGTSAITPIPNSIIRAQVGAQVIFTATPFEGYVFIGWYNDIGLWSSNATAGVQRSTSQFETYEARFRKITISTTPSPTPSRTPQVGISPTPSPTPQVGISPTPTPVPSRTPDPTIVPPPVSPFVSQTPRPSPAVSRTPVPSPAPITWRDCVSGNLNVGTAPSGYREISYPSGGTCWEPISDLGFTPNLSDALLFVHERGGPLPSSKRITATNPSYGKSYRVRMETDENIIITPNNFIVPPRQSIEFVVAITYGLIDILGDGSSALRMDVTITEI